MRRTNIIILALLCLIIAPIPTLATGGIFSGDDDPIHINELKITYAVDSEAGTITMVIRAQYVGTADNFVWLIPVPDDEPVVQFDDFIPTPSISIRTVWPPSYCGQLYDYDYLFGSGGGPPFGRPEPDNYTILSSENTPGWMQDHGYNITPEALDVINDYSSQGMSFVAMELSQNPDATAGRIGRFMITYEANTLTLPLRLTTFSSGDIPGGVDSWYATDNKNIPITITIMGDARFIPTNFEQASIDFSKIHPPHAVGNMPSPDGNYDYKDERTRAISFYEGRAFVTEYAGPSAEITLMVETGMSEELPYFTQLYGEIPPEQMTVDPVFLLNTEAPGVPKEIDLTGYVDPLEFQGCSTRTLRDDGGVDNIAVLYEHIVDDLPSGLTNRIAHPEGWVQSTFNVNGKGVGVFSPEVVDEATVLDYFNGETTPPMFLRTSAYITNNHDHPSTSELFDLPYDEIITHSRLYRALLHPYHMGSASVYMLLTSEEDFAANEAMYRAMIGYPFTFRYYRHDELLHTVFFEGSTFGYPEGWIESVDNEGRLLIMPDDADNPDDAPYLHMYPVSDIAEPPERGETYDDTLQIRSDWLEEHFGIDSQMAYETMAERSRCAVDYGNVSFFFSSGGRTGYVGSYNDKIIEVSAPDMLYEEYADVLEAMNDSIETQYGCG